MATTLGPRGDANSYANHHARYYPYSYSHCRTDTDANSVSRDNTFANPDSHGDCDSYHPTDTRANPVSRNNTVTNPDSYGLHCTHGNTFPDTRGNRDANSHARTSRESLYSSAHSDR